MEDSANPSFVMHTVCSVDGFISREDSSADWLSEWGPDPAGCGEFFDSVDGLVAGVKTYDQMQARGKWPYGEKPCIVLSNRARKPAGGSIEFFTGRVEEIVNLVRKKNLMRVRIVGGASIFTQFHKKRLIDDYIIAIVPIILGSGMPIIQSCDVEARLRLVSSRALDSGIVLNHYRRA